mgnify:FL=1
MVICKGQWKILSGLCYCIDIVNTNENMPLKYWEEFEPEDVYEKYI